MKSLMLALLCAISSFNVFAGEDPLDSTKLLDELKRLEAIETSLKYKTGKVVLQNGMATINIAPGFRFLEAEDTRMILEDVWGNMKGQKAIGMIIPEGTSAIFADYAFLVEFEEMGYVKDEDADKINYDDLLKDMKEESMEANKERVKVGHEAMHLLGWASKPYYDKEKKILYWAKEYKVGMSEENTLNYDVRILGRKGVLVLQAVSSMNSLDSVNKNIPNILGMVAFNEGHKYSDFDSNVDDVAAWTIGGLVAGKMLAKAGLFALVLKNIKLVLLGLAAAGGAIWKFISGRRRKEEVYDGFETVEPEVEQR
ncbi:MAG: DUF2167 domain-containing protein [Flavisolibacter sp.]|jgi:uncharacterized membrane-anchored protein|nr:DUF2167 domain-containing protein [Flavisolibacter sp.]